LCTYKIKIRTKEKKTKPIGPTPSPNPENLGCFSRRFPKILLDPTNGSMVRIERSEGISPSEDSINGPDQRQR
jgi:hypothetical protein